MSDTKLVRLKCWRNLFEEQLLRSQLSHQSLQLGATHVILEGAEVKLGGRAIQHTHAEFVVGIRTISALLFADGNAMASLLVREQFGVYQCTIGVHLVKFATRNQ